LLISSKEANKTQEGIVARPEAYEERALITVPKSIINREGEASLVSSILE